MKQKKALVGNAADEKQVKEATEKAELIREQELNDLRWVCSHPQGRRFLWRLLSKCKVFGTIWDNSAKIHYNSGQQDIGHFIMAELAEADEEILFQMMKEAKESANKI